MLKKILIGASVLGLSALLVSSAATFGEPSTGPSVNSATIALVNEDHSAPFNGSEYLFGKKFVDLVARDNRYNWQVVSRSVAEKAYADEAVQAVIVLPRSFSHDILSLQDLDPVQARIDYKVAPGDALSQQRLQNEVSSILRDFNARVVQLYFASVAGNISEAQSRMSTVVDSHARLVGTLSDSLHPDAEKIATKNDGDISLTEILRSMNAAWIQSQNGFTQSTTSTLTSTSASLARQQPSLDDYFVLQRQIAERNAANGNIALSDQAAADQQQYDAAFSAHIDGLLSGDGTWSGLRGMDSVDADGTHTGVRPTLQRAVSGYDALAREYNGRVEEVVASLNGRRAELVGSITALEELETTLLEEYFTIAMPADNSTIGAPAGASGLADESYDIDLATLTAAHATKALAQKLAKTLSGGNRPMEIDRYVDRISALVASISTDPVAFDELSGALHASSGFDSAPYAADLQLIKRYADANTIASPPLDVLRPMPGGDQSVTTGVSVTVEAGDRQTLDVSVPAPLTAADVTVTTATSPECPGCVQVDAATQTVTVDNSSGESPVGVTVTYTIRLRDAAGTVKIDFTAQGDVGAPAAQIIRSDVYVLDPANAGANTVSSSVAGIAGYLGDIRTAAQLLHALYGGPDEDLGAFVSAVTQSGDFPGHRADSVVNRYGVIDAATIEKRLHPDDVDAYLALGRHVVSAIIEQIRLGLEHRAQIDADLRTLASLHLSPSFFSSALSGLEEWYAAATTAVHAAPERWQEQSPTVIQLTTVPWDGQQEGRAELYLDERTGPMLYESLTELVKATSAAADGVAASANAISDNSAQFDDLLVNIQRTQADTRALLDAMNGSIATGSADRTTAGDYSARFSTVLSNTRANGADPAKIYESFATPVTTRDTTSSSSNLGDSSFDYRWPAIFLAGTLIGILGAWLTMRRRPVRREPSGASPRSSRRGMRPGR
ncbi:type VII secretion protein EsaA [Leifsonia sp. NPDC077715]|uniref:type VII secretion protein EsaA n=1 Tax=Leifsonia sp. NPDC077715 TaxID=3155539 RepID=UPI00343889B0